jgi:hypothetical protein
MRDDLRRHGFVDDGGRRPILIARISDVEDRLTAVKLT